MKIKKTFNRSDFLVQNVRLHLPVHCLQITFYAITEALKSKEAIHKSEILCNLVPLTNQQTCKSFFGAFFENDDQSFVIAQL